MAYNRNIKSDNVCVGKVCDEQMDKINFYRNDKERYLYHNKEHQLIYEKSLINDCKILNNVI